MTDKLGTLKDNLSYLMDKLDNYPVTDDDKDTPKDTRKVNPTQKTRSKTVPKVNSEPTINLDQFRVLIKEVVEPIVGGLSALTDSHNELRDSISAQNQKIEELQKSDKLNREGISGLKQNQDEHETLFKRVINETNHLRSDTADLYAQLDDTQQSLLQKGTILSGPLIEKFLNEHPNVGRFSCNRDHPTTAEFNAMLRPPSPITHDEAEDSSTVESANGMDSTGTRNENGTLEDRSEPTTGAVSEEPVPAIESIRKVAEGKLAVEVTARDDVHQFFGLSKKMNRSFFINEQLTRVRQTIMYDIRNYLRTRPELKGSCYTRNGTPMMKLAGQEPIAVKSQRKLDDVIKSFEQNSSPRRRRTDRN